MKALPLFRSLRGNSSGATGILVGASLTALTGAAALAIDLGSLYLAERRLQGVADAAALAATSGDIGLSGRTRAQAIIDKARLGKVTISEWTPGEYLQDRSLPYDKRFTATPNDPTAARIVLEQTVPLFFGVVATNSNRTTVRAEAIAARADLTAFSLGTTLAELSGGIANKMLSQLAGTELNLSVMDSRILASANVDLLGFADAIKAEVGGSKQTYAEAFDSEIPLSQVIEALAGAAADSAAADLLHHIAMRLDGTGIRLSDIIDLGPMGQSDINHGNSPILINAYALLRSVLELSQGDSYLIAFDTQVPGIAKTTLTLAGGGQMRTSPWLTVTSARDYVIRTSQSRILIDTQVGTGGLGSPLVRLPFYVELAEAEARLSDIACTGDDAADGVTLRVTPSVGTLAIAAVDRARLPDLSRPIDLAPATLANLAIAKVKGFAEIELGGTHPHMVRFTMDDIARRRTKTVVTDDIARSIASSLARKVDLDLEILGLGLGADALLGVVGNALGLVAPAVDGLLYETTQVLGIRLGAADVRVDMARCGVPKIVV